MDNVTIVSTIRRPAGDRHEWAEKICLPKCRFLDVCCDYQARVQTNRLEVATMQYMLLIYESEGRKLSPAEQGQLMQEYMAFTQDIVKAGKFKAGDPLEPTATATTVRVRNGKVATTDGPFAETKEQLGGYYIVEAKDLDEAVSLAARIPGARTGSIEVRPIMKMGG
jgi:hypothetical protein